MYQKYQTEALVLSAREVGESDRMMALFTRDFGLVRARAAAVRSEKSKMRYALQFGTLSNVSLVKGKRGWRVAGATALQNAGGDIRGLSAYARIAELILRLVVGEEANPYLFAALKEAHGCLSDDKPDAFAAVEIVCVARSLYALGYLSPEALETTLLTHTAYGEKELVEAEEIREKLLHSINRALSETQL